MSRRQRATGLSQPLLTDCWPGDVRLGLMGATEVVGQLHQLLTNSASGRSHFSDPFETNAKLLRETVRLGLQVTLECLSDLLPRVQEESLEESLMDLQKAVSLRQRQLEEDENQRVLHEEHLRRSGVS